MDGARAGDAMRVGERLPKRSHHELERRDLGFAPAVDANPLRARRAPGERPALGDHGDVVAAVDQSVAVRDRDANAAGELCVLEKVGDAQRLGHRRNCSTR